MSASATVQLTDVFLIVLVQQWIKLYQALDTQSLLSKINPMLVLISSWDLFTAIITWLHDQIR